MFEKEGYELMGAAFEVYNVMGFGFLEEVYQQSMEIELCRRQIPYRPQQELKLQYRETLLKKTYIADIVVYEGIVVELKACTLIIPEHVAQLMNYLKASQMSVGYLINFGNHEKLEWRRIVLE